MYTCKRLKSAFTEYSLIASVIAGGRRLREQKNKLQRYLLELGVFYDHV